MQKICGQTVKVLQTKRGEVVIKYQNSADVKYMEAPRGGTALLCILLGRKAKPEVFLAHERIILWRKSRNPTNCTAQAGTTAPAYFFERLHTQ